MHKLASTRTLAAGDVLIGNGDKVVASTERDMDNLGAMLIRFTNGTWFHAGVMDVHMVRV